MGHPSDHPERTAQDFNWKPLFSDFWQVVLPGKGRYMFQAFGKVAYNTWEYAKKVWDDSDKNSWRTLVTTVCVLPKIPIEKRYFFQFGEVVIPEKGRYLFLPFRKVAYDIREYAQKVWDDSETHSWGTQVSTVCVLPKISIENP